MKTSLLSLLACIHLGLWLSACNGEKSTSELHKVVGSDDRIGVDPADPRTRPVFEATGVINGKCMVTALSPTIGITAGHCVLYPYGEYEGVVKDVPCVMEDIRWYVNDERSRCVKVLAAELNDFADYAFVALSNAPQPLGIPDAATFRLDYMGPIAMLGIDKDGVLKRSECSILGLDAYSDRRFKHDCDTEPGASGSLMFLPGELNVLGVHNGAAIPKEPWNYATIYSGDLQKTLFELVASTKVEL